MTTRDRRQGRQAGRVDGRRSSDPALTTADVAARLGVSPAFVLKEIRAQRLTALVLRRAPRRAVYRIGEDDLAAYLAKYLWSFQR